MGSSSESELNRFAQVRFSRVRPRIRSLADASTRCEPAHDPPPSPRRPRLVHLHLNPQRRHQTLLDHIPGAIRPAAQPGASGPCSSSGHLVAAATVPQGWVSWSTLYLIARSSSSFRTRMISVAMRLLARSRSEASVDGVKAKNHHHREEGWRRRCSRVERRRPRRWCSGTGPYHRRSTRWAAMHRAGEVLGRGVSASAGRRRDGARRCELCQMRKSLRRGDARTCPGAFASFAHGHGPEIHDASSLRCSSSHARHRASVSLMLRLGRFRHWATREIRDSSRGISQRPDPAPRLQGSTLAR